MSKSIICLVVVSMVFIISVGIANAMGPPPGHVKAKFESIMVGESGEVPGSECKIDTNNDVKIEIEPVEMGTYTCCINTIFGPPVVFEQVVEVDDEGELECSGPIDAVGLIGGVFCQVLTGDGGCFDGGDLIYISGVDTGDGV